MSKQRQRLWEPIASEPLADDRLLREIRVALRSDLAALDRHLERLPGLVGRFALLRALATQDYLEAKHRREKLYARYLDKWEFAKDLAETLDKKSVPLDQLKAAIELQPDYEQARQLETAAHARKILLDAMLPALEEKGRSLQMLGAQRRDELKGSGERSVRGG